MRRLQAGLAAIALLVFVPAVAFAQASITGVVKDASGAVLPGVTVEASSPALIEKTRSAVSDGTGTYRIVDLRPGTYAVTFTLTGFSTVKRDGVELTGSFNATINAEMKVGALEETITVTGETPIVDTQSVRRQVTVSNDVISNMPAARSYAGVMMLIPATTTQAGANLDIQVTPGMLVFGGAGGRTNEARIQVDGLNTGAAFNGAGVSSYVVDIGNAQEISMTTSGGLGEAEVGGPSFSIVPKTGGNSFKGSAYESNVAKGMVGDNYTQALKDAGLNTPGKLYKLWDTNVGVGGPIQKDRLWFFTQFRNEGSYRTVPGMFANLNMGNPAAWTYVADQSRPAVTAGSWMNGSLRLTVQPTPRNKINVFWDQQIPCQGAGYLGTNQGCRQSGSDNIICGAPGASNPPCTATAAPEIGTYLAGFGQRVQQATWSSPYTNKLLLEAGFGTYWSQWGGIPHPGSDFTELVGVTEQCAPSCPNNGNIPNLQYRSGTYRWNLQGTVTWRASAAYVTGAQSMKFGYQGGYLYDNENTFTNDQFLAYRFNNGVPNQITENINAFPANQRVRYDAFFAQDQKTFGRITLQGALRYDRAWSYFPAVTIDPQRFLPQGASFPYTDGVHAYNDITPRAGAAIDAFGDGKTSIKVNIGKYLQAAQNGLAYAAQRPSGRLQTTTTRTWNDQFYPVGDPRRSNFVPDCDLSNPNANGECLGITNTGFGTSVFTSDLDPKLVSGWGVRPGDWGFGASVQQQVLARVSVEVGYNRRWLTNFTWDDNVLEPVGQFGTYTIVSPSDPRLPSGGGATSGVLFNANPSVSTLNNTITKLATDLSGGNYSQVYNGVLLNVSARPKTGLVFQGGVSTGTQRTDYCGAREASPAYTVLGAQGPTNPWCNTSTGFVTRYTGLGSYTVPKVDVLVSGTFRSDAGAPLAANWTITNAPGTPGAIQWASIQQQLGRPLSNGATSVTVNVVEPGTLYGDRVNEFDARLAKIIRIGRTRTNIGFDLYNLLNSSAILSYNQAFSPSVTTGAGAWLAPQSVLQPRFWKFSVQVDF